MIAPHTNTLGKTPTGADAAAHVPQPTRIYYMCACVEIKMHKRITAVLLLPPTNHRLTSKPLAVSNIVIVGKFRQRDCIDQKNRNTSEKKTKTEKRKPLTNCTAGKIVIFALISSGNNGPKCTCCRAGHVWFNFSTEAIALAGSGSLGRCRCRCRCLCLCRCAYPTTLTLQNGAYT